jgi:phage/plasmid-associated DNA primase
MTQKKTREKVIAEINLTHVAQFAAEIGRAINQEEATAFLNCEGRAYEMWKQMMRAGGDYIKSQLREKSRFALQPGGKVSEPRRMAV